MLKERIMLIITIIFSLLCSVWFVKLAIDSHRRASVLDESATIRAGKAREHKSGIIKIGVATNSENLTYDQLVQGVALAVDVINSENMLKNYKLELVIKDDHGKVDTARKIAQAFADDMDIDIVIGHPDSSIAINVQPIYDFYGIIFFTPSASTPRLSFNGSKLFFRNYPNDAEIGAFIAKLADKLNARKIALVYPETVYGRGVANALESNADLADIEISARDSFDAGFCNFSNMIEQWKSFYSFDVIVGVFVTPEKQARFIEAVKKKELNVPIILTPEVSAAQKDDPFGAYKNSIYLIDVKPEMATASDLTRAFVEKFNSRYGQKPNYVGFDSFEALYILAQAINQAGCPSAPDVAKVLHESKGFNSLSGKISFRENGDPNKKINILQFKPRKEQ